MKTNESSEPAIVKNIGLLLKYCYIPDCKCNDHNAVH